MRLVGMVIRRWGCTLVEPVGKILGCLLVEYYFCNIFIFYNHVARFLLFTLSGWSKRAPIARGNQRFLKDFVTLSLSLSLAIVAVDTAENEPLKI